MEPDERYELIARNTEEIITAEELKALLEKALSFYPEDVRIALLASRRRPRRKGKPL